MPDMMSASLKPGSGSRRKSGPSDERVEKKCSRCGETKPAEAFYVIANGKLFSYCKPCAAAASKVYQAANPDKKRQADKRYAEKHRERLSAYTVARRQRLEATDPAFVEWRREYYRLRMRRIRTNPVLVMQRAAHAAVRKAIVSGALVRPDACSVCLRSRRIDAHHPDYSKPLEVIWVCRSCHAKTWTVKAKSEARDASAG